MRRVGKRRDNVNQSARREGFRAMALHGVAPLPHTNDDTRLACGRSCFEQNGRLFQGRRVRNVPAFSMGVERPAGQRLRGLWERLGEQALRVECWGWWKHAATQGQLRHLPHGSYFGHSRLQYRQR